MIMVVQWRDSYLAMNCVRKNVLGSIHFGKKSTTVISVLCTATYSLVSKHPILYWSLHYHRHHYGYFFTFLRAFSRWTYHLSVTLRFIHVYSIFPHCPGFLPSSLFSLCTFQLTFLSLVFSIFTSYILAYFSITRILNFHSIHFSLLFHTRILNFHFIHFSLLFHHSNFCSYILLQLNYERFYLGHQVTLVYIKF